MATAYKTPLDMLYQWEKTEANRVYLRQPVDGQWTEYTWAQFADQVRRMASALKGLGIEKGDRVAIMSKNCAHWFMADMAIMMVGGVSVPIYQNQQGEITNYVLTHSETKAVFIGKLDDTKALEGAIPEQVITIGLPYKDGMKNPNHQWDDLVKAHSPLKGFPTANIDDLLTIIYTSGTTGYPKGVVHTYRAACFAAGSGVKILDIGKKDSFLSFLPLSHVAERFMVEYISLYGCTQISFVESLETFAQNIQDVQPTIFFAVPRLWVKFQMGILEKLPEKKLSLLLKLPVISGLIKNKVKKGLGLGRARVIISGAAPLAVPVMDWFDRLDIKIHEGYGLTENFAYGLFNLPGHRVKGTVGINMREGNVKISEEGEILFKSEALMQGYYKEPEKTAEVFTEDGFLRTGDRGVVDGDGFYRITGRVKEIFKTAKGKYVAPAPIESMLSENSDIEQMCVMGTGLPSPVALVVPSDVARTKEKAHLTKELELTLKKVNQRLESHEKMSKVFVVAEPWTIEDGMMTPTFKIKRHLIEKKYQPFVDKCYGEKSSVVWEG